MITAIYDDNMEPLDREIRRQIKRSRGPWIARKYRAFRAFRALLKRKIDLDREAREAGSNGLMLLAQLEHAEDKNRALMLHLKSPDASASFVAESIYSKARVKELEKANRELTQSLATMHRCHDDLCSEWDRYIREYDRGAPPKRPTSPRVRKARKV